jgi:serine/threonine-protein kinase
VGEWVETTAHQALALRANRIAEIESSSGLTDLGKIDLATQVGSLGPPSNPSSGSLEPPPQSQSSQLSSISLSKPGAQSMPPSRRMPWVAIVLGSGATLLFFAVIVAAALSSRSKATLAPRSAGTVTATVAVTPPPAPTESFAPTATTMASAPATASATTKTTAVAVGRPRPPPTVKTTAAAPANASANCNPPYTLDAEGHKIWKKECL